MLLAGLGAASEVLGAELRGEIVLGAGRQGPVSVALMPRDGQPLPKRPVAEQEVRLRDQGFAPAYLVARVGDRLRFVNDGGVYHVLYAPHGPNVQDAVLAKPTADGAATTTWRLSHAGTLYVFCRIHPRSYVRVDVLDTPLQQLLDPPHRFEFRDLAPGRWQLRVAARGGEPVYRELSAFTAPPAIEVTLPGRVPAVAPPRGPEERVEALYPNAAAQP